jgi:hypothetical protein
MRHYGYNRDLLFAHFFYVTRLLFHHSLLQGDEWILDFMVFRANLKPNPVITALNRWGVKHIGVRFWASILLIYGMHV